MFKINLAFVSYSSGKSDFRLQWQKSLTFLGNQNPALVALTRAGQPKGYGCPLSALLNVMVQPCLREHLRGIKMHRFLGPIFQSPLSPSPPSHIVMKLVWEVAPDVGILNVPWVILMCSQGWEPLCLGLPGCYYRIPWIGQFINKRTLFLTVLQAGKCKIKVPGHLVSVRTCFLVHPWPSFSLCPHRTKGAFSWLFYKGTNPLRGLRLHDLIMPKAPPPNTLTLEIRFHLTFSLFITLRLWNQNFWSSICMTLASPFTSPSFLFHISKWTS